MGQISDLLRASLARLDTARYELRAVDENAAYTFMGEGARLLSAAIPQVEALEGATPPEPPAPQFVSPIKAGCVYGATKWLPGSTGVDLFCRRGTPVVAPADCVVEEVIGGQGISGGAEIILALPDKTWAWRYRHVQANVTLNQRVQQGQQVAVVGDTSLDQLGPVPAWAQPVEDQYQHLDLSVDQGTDRFNPQGGGGGNVDADQWLEALGYQGRKLARTPGPPDAGRSMAESIRLMTPAGR